MKFNTLKRTAPALAACIGLTAYAGDGKLTSSELEQGRLYLHQTRNYVIGATRGLSEAQWKFKPASDRWSVAEIVEHIVLAQELALGPIREQLARAPMVSADRDYKQVGCNSGESVSGPPDQVEGAGSPATGRPMGAVCRA